MSEVVEGHIRDHVFRDVRAKAEVREAAAADLIKSVHSYLKVRGIRRHDR